MNGTGITAEQVITISGVVTIIAQVLKGAGVSGRWALLIAAILSALAVALFGYSNVGFAQNVAWSYFAAWAAVFSSAAGIFGIINAAPAQALAITESAKHSAHKLVQTLKGTGDGTS
jgi:hypothetical protein